VAWLEHLPVAGPRARRAKRSPSQRPATPKLKGENDEPT
jgi:hypothetical protein